MMIQHKRYFQRDILIQTTQLYDFVRKDSTEQFSRQVRFWKGPRLPWTNSWETSSLLWSTSSFTFSLVLSMPSHCLFKDLGGEVAFPLSFFWLLSLVALALGATGRLCGRFWKCETGGTALDRFLGGFGSCGEIFPCKVEVCRTVPNRSGGLQNRSEPFWGPLR